MQNLEPKIENYFILELLKKKIWTNLQRIKELFTQKIVIKFSYIWVWDPRSGNPEKTYSGSRTQGVKGTGSLIRIGNNVR
jgi:hypothetical protein